MKRIFKVFIWNIYYAFATFYLDIKIHMKYKKIYKILNKL
jgi:hypothetical protein